MTAILTIQHRARESAVHVLTDGATYDEKGVSFQMPKTWPLPHLNAVLCMSGSVAVCPLALEWLCAKAASYESARVRLVEVAREVQAFLDPIRHQLRPGMERFLIVLAGIDADGEPDCVVVSNHQISNIPAFERVTVGDLFMMPSPGPGVSLPARADYLDPVTDGVRLMQAQRAVDPSMVGKFVTCTTVRATGIETRVIHRWDD